MQASSMQAPITPRSSILQTQVEPYLLSQDTQQQVQSLEEELERAVNPDPSSLPVSIDSIPLWATTDGTLLKDSGIFIDGSNNVTGINDLYATTIYGTIAGSIASAHSFIDALQGDVTGFQDSTVVSNVPAAATVGDGATTAADVANATTQVEAAAIIATPNTLVLRDSTGNFSGNLSGRVTGTADYAYSFINQLVGDVTGYQYATVVSNVANSATTAASINTASAIVARDMNGTFTATTIYSDLVGSVTGNFTGNLIGNVTGALTGNADTATLAGNVTNVATKTATAVANATTAVETATWFATPSTLVLRDSTGNFSGNLSGRVTGTADYAYSFINQLVGDVTGYQDATVVGNVPALATVGDGSTTAAAVASATTIVETATTIATANTLVLRDGAGNFTSNIITATLIGNVTGDLTGNVTGNLTGNVTGDVTGNLTGIVTGTADYAYSFIDQLAGDVTGYQAATVVGNVPALATVGDGSTTAAAVASATTIVETATTIAIANTLVLRDGAGNFTSNIITATLIGNVTGDLTGNVTGNLTGNVTGDVTGNLTGIVTGTADYAYSFIDQLAGDVTGYQAATVVGNVPALATVGDGSTTAAAVALATTAVETATSEPLDYMLVKRDGTGNFSASKIFLNNYSITEDNQVPTKSYVDTAAATGLRPHDPARTYTAGTISIDTGGLLIIDGVQLVDNDRVLVNASPAAIDNGLWLSHVSTWSRPADFDDVPVEESNGTYVLISEGTQWGGSSWLITGTATIDTDPIAFAQFSQPGQIEGQNIGDGTGNVFASFGGTPVKYMSLRTLKSVPGSNITVSTVGDTVEIATTNPIVANVTGNVTGNLAGSMIGTVTLLPGTLGVVHSAANGVLSSSLIINSDITPATITNASISASAGIDDTKLATINTIGKVTNLATTATAINAPYAIVARDMNGTFTATKIYSDLVGSVTGDFTGNLIGNVTGDVTGNLIGDITGDLTGHASLDILKSGDSMTSTFTVIAGTASSPSLQFAGSTNTGLSALVPNRLSFDTAGVEWMSIDSVGTVTINALGSGVVHSVGGQLSSSLIINSDITPATITNASISASAGIDDTKLATIDTIGKVTNLATTATAINVPYAIVARDMNGTFTATKIYSDLVGSVTGNFTGNLIGNVAGNTTGNVTGAVTGTLTGTANGDVVLNNGSAAMPSLSFAVDSNTGIYHAATDDNTLRFVTNGTERMTIDAVGTVTITQFGTAGVVHNLAGGALLSSLIVNSDITPATITNTSISASAGIDDTKLATINTIGKVTNLATTATAINAPDAIVARDSVGTFTAIGITATNFYGALTGAASLNVLKTGDTMSGVLTVTYQGINNPSFKIFGSTTGVSSTNGADLGLVVGGSAKLIVDATKTTANQSIQGIYGTATAPAYTFSGDPNTGIYHPTPVDTIGFVTNGSERLYIDAVGTVTISALGTGVVHSTGGRLSSSAIVNADITDNTITGAKLTQTPTTANSANTIVLRNNNGDFGAGTITAGHIATTSATVTNALSAGSATITGFTAAGVVHNALTTGALSSSLIVNNDITNLTITDAKLATISTIGKVTNLATTATVTNAAGAIVQRDGTGSFAAGTITHAVGTAPLPSITFAGDTNTGIYHPAAADTIGFVAGGFEVMRTTTAIIEVNTPFGFGLSMTFTSAQVFDVNIVEAWISTDMLKYPIIFIDNFTSGARDLYLHLPTPSVPSSGKVPPVGQVNLISWRRSAGGLGDKRLYLLPYNTMSLGTEGFAAKTMIGGGLNLSLLMSMIMWDGTYWNLL
jgi:hypothetical protein